MNNLSHYVLVLRLLPLLKKTAETAPPTTVRVVMQSSEMHRVTPSNVKFESKEEINKEIDGSMLYVLIPARPSLPRCADSLPFLFVKIRSHEAGANLFRETTRETQILFTAGG